MFPHLKASYALFSQMYTLRVTLQYICAEDYKLVFVEREREREKKSKEMERNLILLYWIFYFYINEEIV